jgi:hypothetical protein
MTEDSSSPPQQRTTPFTSTWIVSTAVLTVVAAVVLAEMGYIPMDPVSAAISGALVALVYISYRVAYRIRNDREFYRRQALLAEGE